MRVTQKEEQVRGLQPKVDAKASGCDLSDTYKENEVVKKSNLTFRHYPTSS